MKPNRDSVAVRLHSIKNELGLSIAKLAEQVGTNKNNLSAYLRGAAVPPKEIVENLAKVAKVSEEWIYYGHLEDYIRDYLISLGYTNVVITHPEIISNLVRHFKSKSLYNDESLPKDSAILETFLEQEYMGILKEYIIDLLHVLDILQIIDDSLIYSSDRKLNRDSYLEAIISNMFLQEPSVKYGEAERIYKIIEDIIMSDGRLKNEGFFEEDWYSINSVIKKPNQMVEKFLLYRSLKNNKEQIQIYKNVDEKINSLLDYLIDELKTERGTLNMIIQLASHRNIDIDLDIKDIEDVINVFQEMLPKLQSIKEKY